jgi:hypothetical protein
MTNSQVTYSAVESLHEGIEASASALLTVGNPKTAKGEGYGYLTAILHLAPAKLAGFEVCSARTAGCTEACLNTSGMQGKFRINVISARIRKTKWFRADRDGFMQRLERDIAAHVRSAKRHGLKPCVRLNGTSDIPWENVRYTRADGSKGTIFERFPDVQFYDYTKLALRFKRALPSNYDLTYSAADGNENAVALALSYGARIAVVFGNSDRPNARKWKLPATFEGTAVVDADAHDLRFTEPSGVICGLRAKGLAKRDDTGFVKWVKPT